MNEDEAWVDIISGLADEDLVTETSIDKLIDDHKKAIKEHRAEIKRSQRSIENLEYKKKKLKYGDNTVVFEVAERLELFNTINGYSPFPPHVFDWSNFVAEQELFDAEHVYYGKAQKFIQKANELGISIRKAFKLIDEISA